MTLSVVRYFFGLSLLSLLFCQISLLAQESSSPEPRVQLRQEDSDDLTLPQSNASPSETITTTTIVQQPATGAISAQQLAQNEARRRQNLLASGSRIIYDADRLREAGQLTAAAERYKYLIDNLSSGGLMAPLYNRAKLGLAATDALFAQMAERNKKWMEAVKFYHEAIALDPSNKVYQRDLNKLKHQLGMASASAKPEPIKVSVTPAPKKSKVQDPTDFFGE